MKYFGLTTLAVVLSGCGPSGPSVEERRCTSYGYKSGTDSYRDCIAEESRAQRQADRARRDAIIFGGSRY